MHPDGLAFRVCILLSAGGITISSNAVMQIYAVMQPAMTRSRNCNGTAGVNCCHDCLGIGDFNYNTFHGVTYTVSIFSLWMGFLFDKFGNGMSILVSLCSVIGTGLVALGATLSPSSSTLPLIFVGAGVWGVGCLPAYIARERIIGIWFRNRELRLAFGLTAAINRLPGLFTFTLTERLRESVGLQLTLWMATLVCMFSLACAVCATVLDSHGNRQLGLTHELKQEASAVGIFDIRHAKLEYWLLLGGFACFTTVVFTFQDNAIEFINEKFDFTKSQASMIGGILQYPGIVLAPAIGVILDKVGRSSLFFAGASFTLLPAVSLLAFTDVHPAVGTAVIGVAYCFVSTSSFASVPLVVSRSILGVATSLCLCLNAVFGAVLRICVGRALGWELNLPLSVRLHRWTVAMSLILSVACINFLFAISLAVSSWLRGSVLGHRPKPQYQSLEEEEKEEEKEELPLKDAELQRNQ